VRALVALLPVMTLAAANYTAERVRIEDNEVIRLHDQKHDTEVLILPSFGNNAFSMKVKGQQILWSPYASLTEWKAKPVQAGNPLLAPWCNRIDGDTYWANGKPYLLNASLNNFRRDANQQPIHGLLVFASWTVTKIESGAQGAVTTSRLDFFKHPDWMAQFPFAHSYEMTHRLKDGVLEVETLIQNHSVEPMPVSLGYHTYYQLTDSPRDDWNVKVAARQHVVLSSSLIPTGEVRANQFADPFPLRNGQLDDVFTGLERDTSQRAAFWVQGKRQRVTVEFGPNYPVAVIYAPAARGFICFEPMTGVTNVFNLSHQGKFPLQRVAPGAEWRESFWVRPSGF
jgi:aldose 1-epimerase